MIPAAIEAGIPVIVGTAGGSGGQPHVKLTLDIIREIAQQKELSFKIAVIQSEFDKTFVKDNIRNGNISPLFPAKELSEEDVSGFAHKGNDSYRCC